MPVKIHNKEYRTVAERIELFYSTYKKGWVTAVTTEIIKDEGSIVQVKATISAKDSVDTPKNWVFGTGMAEEDRTKGMINKTSALENAETSALGRALASIGLGGEEFASADELVQALENQQASSKNAARSKDASTISFGKHKGKSWNKIPYNYLEFLSGKHDLDSTTKEMVSAEIKVRDVVREGELTEEKKEPKDAIPKVKHNEEKKEDNKNKENKKVSALEKKSVGQMIKNIGNGALVVADDEKKLSPLSIERERRDLASELTNLSELLGMETFQKIKKDVVGTKGFTQCEIEELRELKKVCDENIPQKTKEDMAKNEELFDKVLETFDGEIISK
jgi:hypothetical protein